MNDIATLVDHILATADNLADTPADDEQEVTIDADEVREHIALLRRAATALDPSCGVEHAEPAVTAALERAGTIRGGASALGVSTVQMQRLIIKHRITWPRSP